MEPVSAVIAAQMSRHRNKRHHNCLKPHLLGGQVAGGLSRQMSHTEFLAL